MAQEANQGGAGRGSASVAEGGRAAETVPSRRDPEQLAREFEPSGQAIRNWIGQADREEGAATTA